MTITTPAENIPPKPSRVSSFNRTSVLLFALFAGLFIAARLWRLTSSCLWFDEIFSVHAARHNWGDLFYFVAADIIHPPLFYFVLKIWTQVGGESILWLRLLPALIGIAAIIPFSLLCREIRLNSSETNLALLLLAANGYLIKYAQEVRMYSLLFFLSTCSLWLFFALFKRDKVGKALLGWLCLVNLLLVYTHYAGWIVVLLELVLLAVWQRRKVSRFLITVALTVLAYAPWIYLVLKVAKSGATRGGVAENIGWVTKPGFLDLVQYFVLLNRPFLFIQSSTQTGYSVAMFLIVFALFGIPLLFFFLKFSKSKGESTNRNTHILTVFIVFPAVVAFVLSWLSPYSIWGTRHLIVASVPYAILASIAVVRLQPVIFRTLALIMIGCWVALSAAVFTISRPPSFIWCAWETLGQQLADTKQNSSQPVQVYAYEDLVAYHLWFALNSPPADQFKTSVIKGVPGIQEDPAYFLPRAFSEISVQQNHFLIGDESWIAFRANAWDETRPPLSMIKASGFEVGQVFSAKAQGQQAFMVQLRRRTD